MILFGKEVLSKKYDSGEVMISPMDSTWSVDIMHGRIFSGKLNKLQNIAEYYEAVNLSFQDSLRHNDEDSLKVRFKGNNEQLRLYRSGIESLHSILRGSPSIFKMKIVAFIHTVISDCA